MFAPFNCRAYCLFSPTDTSVGDVCKTFLNKDFSQTASKENWQKTTEQGNSTFKPLKQEINHDMHLIHVTFCILVALLFMVCTMHVDVSQSRWQQAKTTVAESRLGHSVVYISRGTASLAKKLNPFSRNQPVPPSSPPPSMLPIPYL